MTGSSSLPGPSGWSSQWSRPSQTRAAGMQRPLQYNDPGSPAHSSLANEELWEVWGIIDPTGEAVLVVTGAEQPGGSSDPSSQSASPSQYRL